MYDWNSTACCWDSTAGISFTDNTTKEQRLKDIIRKGSNNSWFDNYLDILPNELAGLLFNCAIEQMIGDND